MCHGNQTQKHGPLMLSCKSGAMFQFFFSAFRPYSSAAAETRSTGDRMHPRCSCVAHSGVLYQGSPSTNRLSSAIASQAGFSGQSRNKQIVFTSEQTEADGLQIIRHSLQAQGRPRQTASIIVSAWRKGTKKSYSTYIKRRLLFVLNRLSLLLCSMKARAIALSM